MQHDPLTLTSPLGTVAISSEAVAQVVAHTAGRCYGVVGLSSKRRVGRLLGRGVAVAATPAGLRIELHVVVEHGLNLAEVAATVRSQVGYEVERQTGLTIAAVEVHIQSVRQSA